MAVATGEVEVALIEHAHDLCHGPEFQECIEYAFEPFLHFNVRILGHHPAWIAYKTDRQVERQLAACGLGKKPCGKTAADRVQFEFGYRPLEPEQQAAVRATRIINTVPVGNQTTAESADIQERIPIRTVAGQPRDVDRQDKPDLAEADPADQFLEPTPLCGGGATQAEIGVDHINVGLMPSEIASALPQRVLQPQTFLIAHHLVRRRLSDIDDRLACQMCRFDQL